jgi:hypothetical protein
VPSGLPCPIRGLALLLITRTSPVGAGMEKSQGQGRGPSRYRQDTAEPTSTIEKISDPEEEFIDVKPSELLRESVESSGKHSDLNQARPQKHVAAQAMRPTDPE